MKYIHFTILLIISGYISGQVIETRADYEYPGNAIGVSYWFLKPQSKVNLNVGLNYLVNSPLRYFGNNTFYRTAYNSNFIDHFGTRVEFNQRLYMNDRFQLHYTVSVGINRAKGRYLEWSGTPVGGLVVEQEVIEAPIMYKSLHFGLLMKYALNQKMDFCVRGNLGISRLNYSTDGFYYKYELFSQTAGIGIQLKLNQK